jgi:large subunit ribosomal protein L29
MPIGSKELIVENLDKIEDSLLVEELKKAKEELFNLRFQSATGQLESHGRLRAVKRDISRIYTIIRERELGIRAIPAPGATLPPKAKKAEKPAAEVTDAAAAEVATEEVKAAKPAAKKSSKTETKES